MYFYKSIWAEANSFTLDKFTRVETNSFTLQKAVEWDVPCGIMFLQNALYCPAWSWCLTDFQMQLVVEHNAFNPGKILQKAIEPSKSHFKAVEPCARFLHVANLPSENFTGRMSPNSTASEKHSRCLITLKPCDYLFQYNWDLSIFVLETCGFWYYCEKHSQIKMLLLRTCHLISQ